MANIPRLRAVLRILFLGSNVIGHIHMVSRCYCESSEMLMLLDPTVQQYLTGNIQQFHNKT